MAADNLLGDSGVDTDDPDPLGLFAADEAIPDEKDFGADRARYLRFVTFASVTGALLAILLLVGWAVWPVSRPQPIDVSQLRPVVPEQTTVQKAPSPPKYASKRLILSEAVEQILKPHEFRYLTFGDDVFNDRQFVTLMPPVELPWDEAIERLLKPYRLEYRLDDATVYIGKDLLECLTLTGMSPFALVSGAFNGRAQCDEMKYKKAHPDPLPTDPFYRCMEEKKRAGSTKAYLEDAADCNAKGPQDSRNDAAKAAGPTPKETSSQSSELTTQSEQRNAIEKYSECLVPVFHTDFQIPREGGAIIRSRPDDILYFVKTYLPGCNVASKLGTVLKGK